MNIQMPKACISCMSFELVGFKQDEYCPHREPYSNRPKAKTRYGKCNAHKKHAFITEICGSYQQDDLIDVIDVTNRPAPLEPHQESLNF